MESKLKIYNRVLATRDEMSDGDVVEYSAIIQKRVLLMEEWRTARRIGLYSPHANEVHTKTLFEEADRNRKELYYPRKDAQGELAYYRIFDLSELMHTSEGSFEPSGKQSKLRDLDNMEMAIVPGVAFDLSGARLGFGKGFYDNVLDNFSGVRVALAYDFQIVSNLPRSSAAFCKVDWVVTEKRMIRCI
jgi:5-formyltetrahydrofolate cyclo-ligase